MGPRDDARDARDHDAGIAPADGVELRDLCARVRCPVLVMHGDEDAISPHGAGVALAEATRGEFVTLEGAGHLRTPATR